MPWNLLYKHYLNQGLFINISSYRALLLLTVSLWYIVGKSSLLCQFHVVFNPKFWRFLGAPYRGFMRTNTCNAASRLPTNYSLRSSKLLAIILRLRCQWLLALAFQAYTVLAEVTNFVDYVSGAIVESSLLFLTSMTSLRRPAWKRRGVYTVCHRRNLDFSTMWEKQQKRESFIWDGSR